MPRRPPPRETPAAEPLPNDRLTTDRGPAARAISYVLVLAAVALVAYVRLRIADAPLERDEGEYAYAGQLILQGIPPYELAYNMKFPGTYYAYSVLMAIFGQSPWGIRAGLLLVHAATALLLFALGRRIAGTYAAAIGAASFSLLALDRWSMGVYAHATHFVILPVVAGLLVLHTAFSSRQTWRFVAAGALAGVAMLMKQQAFPFTILFIGLALWHGWRSRATHRASAWRPPIFVGVGALLPFAVTCAVLAVEGVLGRFWFWTFQYAAAYVSQTALSSAMAVLAMAWEYITRANSWLWYAAGAGVVLLLLTRWRGDTRVILVAWLVAAAVAILPGFYFRPHYFILLMPIAGLLIGVGIASLDRLLSSRMTPATAGAVSLVAFLAVAGGYVVRESHYLFRMDVTELTRSVYESNPFPEAVEIGRYIQAHSAPEDRIAVLGSEPEIYFYANRKSATGYIYTYALMEPQPYAARMQDEMIREIETARPAYLVFAGVASSWAARPNSNRRILTWSNQYTAKCYERVGVADIDPVRGTTMRWDAASAGYEMQSPFVMLTFRRKDTNACTATE